VDVFDEKVVQMEFRFRTSKDVKREE